MKIVLVLFIALFISQTYADVSSGFKVAIRMDDLIQESFGKVFTEKVMEFFPTGEILPTDVLSLPLPTLSSEECLVNIMRFIRDKVGDKISQASMQKMFDNFPILLAKKMATEYAWYGLNDLVTLVEDGLAIFYFEPLTEEEAWNGLPDDATFRKKVRTEEHRDILKPLYQTRFLSAISGAGAGSLIGYSLTGLSPWVGAGALIGIHVGQWVYEYIYPKEIDAAYQKLGEDFLRGAYTKKPTGDSPGEEKAWMQKTIQYQGEEIAKLKQEMFEIIRYQAVEIAMLKQELARLQN